MVSIYASIQASKSGFMFYKSHMHACLALNDAYSYALCFVNVMLPKDLRSINACMHQMPTGTPHAVIYAWSYNGEMGPL